MYNLEYRSVQFGVEIPVFEQHMIIYFVLRLIKLHFIHYLMKSKKTKIFSRKIFDFLFFSLIILIEIN